MSWGKRAVAIAWLCGALAACGGGGSGAGGDGSAAELTRFDVSGEVPRALMGRMDAVWIGLRTMRNDEPDDVVVSHDDGRTWQAADLPDRPQELHLAFWGPKSVHVETNLAAVVGRDPRSASPDWPIAKSEFFVWTTRDGVTWDVHVLGTAGGIVGNPTVTAVGSVLVASTSSLEGFNMFTSRDGGASWQPAVISGLDHVPGDDTMLQWASVDGESLQVVLGPHHSPVGRRQVLTSTDGGTSWSAAACGDACTPPGESGDLLFQRGEVSSDGGATWDEVTVEPPMTGDGPPSLSHVVAVPGGWLARATTDEASDISHVQLVRSEDGRTWRQMLPPDPCPGRSGRPNSQLSRPVLLDRRPFVAYGCSDLMFPELALVYVGDAEAREFELVDGSERDGAVFGTPIEDGERLVLPEYGRDDELVGITVIG